MQCGDCIFWIQNPKDLETETNEAECRRFPPQIIPVIGVNKLTGRPETLRGFFFPRTRKDTGCGEFKAIIVQ